MASGTYSHNASFARILASQELPQGNIAEERRKALKLLYYWNSMRGGRELPVEDDIDLNHELIRHMWPYTFIVQVRDFGNKDFNYTYLGEALAQDCRYTLASEEAHKAVSLEASKLMPLYKQVLETRQPMVEEGVFTNRAGTMVKYRQSLFPFGKERVEVILGHISYSISAEGAERA